MFDGYVFVGDCVNRGEEQVAQQGKVILQLEKNEV